MRITVLFWLILGAYACFTLSAKGQGNQQSVPLNTKETSSLVDSTNRKRNLTTNTALNTGPISNLPSVNLTSLFNDVRAEIKIGFQPHGSRSTFNLGVAQSFSDKPKVAKLLDATGLSPGTTLSLVWQYRLTPIPIPSIAPIRDLALFNKFVDEYKAANKTLKNVTKDSISVSFKAPDSIRVRFKVPVKIETTSAVPVDSSGEVGWDDFGPELRAKVLNSCALDLRAFASPWFFKFQFSASRVSFDYIADTLAIKPLSSKQTNRSIEFNLSKYTSLDQYYSLSYSVLYTYLSGDELIPYSFPVSNRGVSYSKDVTVGTPTERIETRLKGELRQLFRDAECTPFLGINPSISALFKTEKINLDLPIYFLTKNDKGVLNGLQAGFRVGYTSKWDGSFWRDFGSFSSDKMYLSLFLSKPFSVND
jgi:hypothetical protein